MLTGGNFHLSDQIGFAADKFVAADVVLAMGSIIMAIPSQIPPTVSEGAKGRRAQISDADRHSAVF